jgi:HK97 family phage prohead protease
MSELLIERSAATALEPVGDGWTVYGLAVPYEREQEVVDPGAGPYLEAFAAHAFNRDVGKGGRWVNLMLGHNGDDGDRYLGRCVALEEDSEGLWPSFRLDRTHPAAEEARSGELRGWSVSARVYRSRSTTRADGSRVVWREICGLSHVAATRSPQYAGAGVTVAREHTLVDAPSETPRLDQLRSYLAGLPPAGA